LLGQEGPGGDVLQHRVGVAQVEGAIREGQVNRVAVDECAIQTQLGALLFGVGDVASIEVQAGDAGAGEELLDPVAEKPPGTANFENVRIVFRADGMQPKLFVALVEAQGAAAIELLARLDI
jgi:hypothetical protein